MVVRFTSPRWGEVAVPASLRAGDAGEGGARAIRLAARGALISHPSSRTRERQRTRSGILPLALPPGPQDPVSAAQHFMLRRARDDGYGKLASRAVAPSFVKERGSAGAAALRNLLQSRAALRRPRRLLPCRGCGHIVSGLIGPAWGPSRPSLSRPGPRAAARHVDDAPLRDGRPCKVLPPLHSLDPRPRNLRRASPHVRRPRRYGRLPQPGHRPRPAKPLKLAASRVGQGCGEYGGAERGGD
jgi:hypothetical protein